jgi:hypothetical protein
VVWGEPVDACVLVRACVQRQTRESELSKSTAPPRTTHHGEHRKRKPALNPVGTTSEPKLTGLHLRLVLVELGRLLLLVGEQSGVLALADAALLDAAEAEQQHADAEDDQRPDDDARLGAGRQRLPVVADARGFLDFFQDARCAPATVSDGGERRWEGDLLDDLDLLPVTA